MTLGAPAVVNLPAVTAAPARGRAAMTLGAPAVVNLPAVTAAPARGERR